MEVGPLTSRVEQLQTVISALDRDLKEAHRTIHVLRTEIDCYKQRENEVHALRQEFAALQQEYTRHLAQLQLENAQLLSQVSSRQSLEEFNLKNMSVPHLKKGLESTCYTSRRGSDRLDELKKFVQELEVNYTHCKQHYYKVLQIGDDTQIEHSASLLKHSEAQLRKALKTQQALIQQC